MLTLWISCTDKNIRNNNNSHIKQKHYGTHSTDSRRHRRPRGLLWPASPMSERAPLRVHDHLRQAHRRAARRPRALAQGQGRVRHRLQGRGRSLQALPRQRAHRPPQGRRRGARQALRLAARHHQGLRQVPHRRDRPARSTPRCATPSRPTPSSPSPRPPSTPSPSCASSRTTKSRPRRTT